MKLMLPRRDREKPNPIDSPGGLLRTNSIRPGRFSAAKKRDELAPLHRRFAPDVCEESVGFFATKVQRVECPLWVKRRHSGVTSVCLLYPQKRTSRFMSIRPSRRRNPPFANRVTRLPTNPA